MSFTTNYSLYDLLLCGRLFSASDNTIWSYGGCAASFYNQLSALVLDVKLSSQNFYAAGLGIAAAKAGVSGT